MKDEMESPRAESSDLACEMEKQRQQWDSVAAGWKKWWRTIESGAHCVSERLIELTEIEPGQRVLDIATGFGEPALLAASRVGHAGRVVATDFSSRMLDIARERAAASGLTNVEFIEADAERLDFPDGSFDSVLWRWGLTSVPNPSTTLVAIRRMLTPRGSFATSVWESGPKGRPLASAAAAVARQMFDLPSPQADAPPLSGSAESTLEQEMMDAGFSRIRVEKMGLILAFSSAEDCTQYLIDVSPELAALLSDKPAVRQAEFRQRVAEELRQYATDDGRVRIPNVTLCAVGRR